jgi:hypothetical protein
MIESYNETRVVMSPNGELLLALPIYANQKGALLEEGVVESITGTKRVSIGIYESFGYLIYHPINECSFYLKSLDLFEDLGGL